MSYIHWQNPYFGCLLFFLLVNVVWVWPDPCYVNFSYEITFFPRLLNRAWLSLLLLLLVGTKGIPHILAVGKDTWPYPDTATTPLIIRKLTVSRCTHFVSDKPYRMLHCNIWHVYFHKNTRHFKKLYTTKPSTFNKSLYTLNTARNVLPLSGKRPKCAQKDDA